MPASTPSMSRVCPVVAVPFCADGAVDFASFSRLVEHLLAEDIGALTLFGLASEFHKLADDERMSLRARFCEQTAAHPGVAGVVSVTDHSTEVAVRRAVEAEAAGADIVNVLPPHFLAPPMEAVLGHLDRVAAAVTIPVVVQYAPVQTGSVLDPEAIASLAARRANVRYVKVEASPPGLWIDRLRAASGGRVASLVGSAGVDMIEGLERGAVGVQPGCSFVPVYTEIMRRFSSGDRTGAVSLHARLLPFITSWMESVEFIVQVEKTILHQRGLIDTEVCRAPGHPLDEAAAAEVGRFLAEFAPYLAAETA